MNNDRDGYTQFKHDVLVVTILYCVIYAFRRGWLTWPRIFAVFTFAYGLDMIIEWIERTS